ncbi:hypothetical protein Ancab_015517, partial [Ancistrocladus abbreviatus]
MGHLVVGCWCWSLSWSRALSNTERLRCNDLLRLIHSAFSVQAGEDVWRWGCS